MLVVAAPAFFAGLGRLPLIEPDEGRNAEVGREMLATGDWITPHYNSFAYLDKPAVFFWLEAASLKLVGVNETAARLPSAVMALATMLLAWFLGRRMFGDAAGLRAGLIFAVCPLAVVLAREVIFDMTLTFFVTLAMTMFWIAEESKFQKPWHVLLMFAAMGFATITKGFVGVLIPLGAVFLYFVARGRARDWLKLRWGWGLPVLLAVALPWFIAVSMRNPDFPRYAFWNESLKRFTTQAAHRGGGPLYYLPVFLGGFFPWSFFLLLAAWNRIRRWRELRDDAARPVLFLLAWAVWVFAFFTVSHSKLPTYFLPAIAPLSVLMASQWRDAGCETEARPPDWLTAGFALLLAFGILVAAASHSWLYDSLHTRLARTLDSNLLDLIQPSLLYAGIIIAAIGFLGRRLAIRARGLTLSISSFALVAVVVPLVFVRCYAPIRLLAETRSSRGLAQTILSSPEHDLPIYGYYYFRTSLPFYLQRPVGLVSVQWGEMTSNYVVARQEAERREATTNPGRGILVTLPEFLALRKTAARPILVMTPNRLVESIWMAAGQIDPLWTESSFSVWKIPVSAGSKPDTVPGRVVPPFQP